MKKILLALAASLALVAHVGAEVSITDGARTITIPAPTPPADLAPLTGRVSAAEAKANAHGERITALEAAVRALQAASAPSTTPPVVTPPPVTEPPPVVTPPAVVLDVHSDPRTVTALDGDKTPQQHPNQIGLQLADGQNVRLNQLSGNAKYHTSGSCAGQMWFGREARPDGKMAYTARICKGQPMFQGDTVRAEWLAPDGGYPGNLKYAVSEKGTYWFAIDYVFDADVASNTGRQYGGPAGMAVSGLHGNTWDSYLKANNLLSNGHSFGSRVEGNVLNWRIHGPGSGPSPLFDVRTTPLSTTVVGQKEKGSNWGTANHWQTWTIQPGVSVKFVGRVKFATSAAGSPRTEIWRKVGSGPMVKIIDTTQPNTFSAGIRYWKTGGYAWEQPDDAWWGNKNTRTMRIRSDLWMRDEAASGRPALNQQLLMDWLER